MYIVHGVLIKFAPLWRQHYSQKKHFSDLSFCMCFSLCLYLHIRIDFSSLTYIVMEKNDFKWRELFKKYAGSSVLEGIEFSITNKDRSWTVEILCGTVKGPGVIWLIWGHIWRVEEEAQGPGSSDQRSGSKGLLIYSLIYPTLTDPFLGSGSLVFSWSLGKGIPSKVLDMSLNSIMLLLFLWLVPIRM